ncbi:head maturation protease, ClpP-related [Burkholderia ubonensis]|uniref:head maturation protease, ClpP-related n=1 Tax=Burkholderia ubonensis TaxID=101571 RepID=UPI00075D77BD|nr:head maturation protease, ClpP-related [Burkholderia ubonensis]KVD52449.1 peptidase [Burkholderia ubonensis]KVU30911.1 peptidase [Burkholderia ubonensis]
MSLMSLPEIKAASCLKGGEQVARPDVLARWQPEIRAAAGDDVGGITINGAIGETWDGTGVTSNRIAAALRSIGAGVPVVVNLNSPGGDFFEGVAIYNLLRQHDAEVTVNVMGLAASAASVIAMAGDKILMGDGAFLMIHNAWSVAVGNRHDFIAAAETLAPFDDAMASLYAKRSGMSKVDAAALMDKETWISADQAVKSGMATGLLDDTATSKGDTKAAEQRRVLATVDSALASTGMSRVHRAEVLARMRPEVESRTTKNSDVARMEASLRSFMNNATSIKE